MTPTLLHPYLVRRLQHDRRSRRRVPRSPGSWRFVDDSPRILFPGSVVFRITALIAPKSRLCWTLLPMPRG